VARIAALMTPRTRVVQVSHVTAPTGILMPVREIGARCRAAGVWFHVDGAQTAGMFPFAVRDLGCDSFATSGHKWWGGPLETGILFVRRERIDHVAPMLVGAHSGELDGPALPAKFAFAAGAARFRVRHPQLGGDPRPGGSRKIPAGRRSRTDRRPRPRAGGAGPRGPG
jgi:selenocysteine lyase/cysteine desulfurase